MSRKRNGNFLFLRKKTIKQTKNLLTVRLHQKQEYLLLLTFVGFIGFYVVAAVCNVLQIPPSRYYI